MRLKKGDTVGIAGGVFTAPQTGIYTVNAGSITYRRNAYPFGVQDFRDLTAEECMSQLEQAIENNPEVAKAIELMNSKLYKALK